MILYSHPHFTKIYTCPTCAPTPFAKQFPDKGKRMSASEAQLQLHGNHKSKSLTFPAVVYMGYNLVNFINFIRWL